MRVVTNLSLTSSDREFRLPGSGSRSMLFRFDEVAGAPIFGAVATAIDGEDFVPGAVLPSVVLHFWAHEARSTIEEGSRFVVWYGGDIGTGVVESVEATS